MASNIPKILIPKKVKIRKTIKFIVRIFWFLVIIFLLIQFYRLNNFLSKTSSLEIQNASSELESLRTDINEIKDYLLLPTHDSKQNNSSEPELSIEQVIASSLQELARESEKERILATYLAAFNQATKTIRENNQLSELLTINGSTAAISGSTAIQDSIIRFGIENNKLFINDTLKQKTFTTSKLQDFTNFFANLDLKYLQDQQLKINAANQAAEQLSTATEDLESIKELLDSRNLKYLYQKSNPYELSFLKQDDNLAFKIIYDTEAKNFQIINDKKEPVSSKSLDFNTQISNLETYLKLNTFPTILQSNIQEKLDLITQTLNSVQFKKTLQKLNAKVQIDDANDTEIHILIVDNTQNKILLKYVISKETGELFYEINQNRKKVSLKNEPTLSNKNIKNFLIAGKHGNLTDTIMLANVNEITKSVNLLSIPRDLYIDGQKINSIYSANGLPALEEKLEQITGQTINSHFLIDMYAFIDVVDYLGGITVSLEEPIEDPTYKTFDNGIWGTMYFAAGEHTLNGRQALRLARSRYTSSDFDRAARQQILLTSIKDKLSNLQVSNAKTLTQIALTMLNKTETNLQLSQAISYFFKYKNFNINAKEVLSTSNVLVSTYSNVFNQIDCQNCGKGAYILIPQNQDWSMLKTYVSSIFSS